MKQSEIFKSKWRPFVSEAALFGQRSATACKKTFVDWQNVSAAIKAAIHEKYTFGRNSVIKWRMLCKCRTEGTQKISTTTF